MAVVKKRVKAIPMVRNITKKPSFIGVYGEGNELTAIKVKFTSGETDVIPLDKINTYWQDKANKNKHL